MKSLNPNILLAPALGANEILNSYLARVSTGGRTQTLRNAARRLLWPASLVRYDAKFSRSAT